DSSCNPPRIRLPWRRRRRPARTCARRPRSSPGRRRPARSLRETVRRAAYRGRCGGAERASARRGREELPLDWACGAIPWASLCVARALRATCHAAVACPVLQGMKLTIFAATGGIGRQALEQALAAGHEVTAVVRNPQKISGKVH